MEVFCPDCASIIGTGSINVNTDLAKCENCGTVHKLSEIVKLSDEQSDNSSLAVPNGSKIVFNKVGESAIEFNLPSSGIKGKSIPFLIFSVFWLTFISFWTIMAAQASIAFALFSIPFWLVGLGILTLTINSAREKQVITLNNEFFTVQKLRPVKSKEIKIKITEIESIRLENFRSFNTYNVRNNQRYNNSNNNFSTLVPVVSYGTKKESFFENSSLAEQKWIVRILSEIVDKLKKEGYLIDFQPLS